MTRIKKTRSLKRIHNIKTGSKSKIKKAQIRSGLEPQRKFSKEKKQLSAYEKYLLENPEAKIADQKSTTKKKANTQVAAENKSAETKEPTVEKTERKKSLFDQFEDTKLKEIYYESSVCTAVTYYILIAYTSARDIVI